LVRHYHIIMIACSLAALHSLVFTGLHASVVPASNREQRQSNVTRCPWYSA
jgi:hypothetical protein